MPLDIEKQLLALGSEWRRSTPPSLRARVADIADRTPSAGQDTVRPAGVSPAWIVGRKMALATAGVILVLLVVPFSRDAIARQAYRLLQSIDIAPNTKLVTSAPRTADEGNTLLRQSYRELGAGRVWQVHTRYGSFGGGVPPNASPDVRRIDQVDALREAASIPLLAPEGPYRGQPVPFDHAMLTPDGLVLAFFGTGNAEVMLVEAPVDRGQQMAFSRSVTGRSGVVVGVPPAPETFNIGAQRVTWDPDTTGVNPNLAALRWEVAGISYSLCGRALSKDEAVSLFSSLHPLN